MISVFTLLAPRTPKRAGIDRHQSVRQAVRSMRAKTLHRLGWLGSAAVLALAVQLPLSPPVAAGSWTLPEDTGRFKINTSRDATADSKDAAYFGPQSETFGVTPHVEYGLTDDLTVGFVNQTQLVKSGLEALQGGRTEGTMTTELFLRGRLRDKDSYRISVQDFVQLPGQEPSAGSGESSVHLQYGRSGRFAIGSWTSSLSTGFHPSVDEAPETVQADLSLGWRPVDRWQVTAQALNTIGLYSPEATGLAGDELNASIGQLSLSHRFSQALSLQVGGWQTMAGGVGEPHGYDAMLWWRY